MYKRDIEGEENIENGTRAYVDFRRKDIGKEIKAKKGKKLKKI